jgi:threonine dehydrogenase-like Zn-dependent dehydrogenase
MKALILQSNGRLQYNDVADSAINADECLIAVKYAGICESDIARAYNNEAYFYPLIMGHEISGIVEEVGSDVKTIKKGDRVAVFPLIPCNECRFCRSQDYTLCKNYDYYGSRRNGGFAEFLAVKEWNLFRLPEEISLADAALLEPVSVAIHAVRMVEFNKTDNVVILGAGIIGLVAAMHLAEIIDASHIFVIDRNDSKLETIRNLGVNAINSCDKNLVENLKKQINGGAECVIEACGAVETYGQSLELIGGHGNLLWIGNIKGDLLLDKKVVSSVLRKEVKIYGVWNSRYTHNKNDDWNYALGFFKSCKGFKNIISHSFPLSKGKEIFEELYLQKTKKSKNEPLPLRVIFKID